MRRIWIILATALIVVAGASAPRSASIAASPHAHTVLAKKKCKTVTKKVHGKKKRVKVCRGTAKPKATGTPTSTPAPTPTPTPLPRLIVTHQLDGSTTIVDTHTGNSATAGGFTCGTYDELGAVPATNDMYFWIQADEKNVGFADYVSSNQNFQISDTSGFVYPNPADPGGPPGIGTSMDNNDLAPGEDNRGWLEVTVPLQPGTYILSWNEGGEVTWTPFATYAITPTGGSEVVSLHNLGSRTTAHRLRPRARAADNHSCPLIP